MKEVEIYIEHRTEGIYWFLVSEYDKVIDQGITKTHKTALKRGQVAMWSYLEAVSA